MLGPTRPEAPRSAQRCVEWAWGASVPLLFACQAPSAASIGPRAK